MNVAGQLDVLTQEQMHVVHEKACELLAKKGVSVWFCNRVGKIKEPGWKYASSAQRRMEAGVGFPAMLRDPRWYVEDLKELFGEKYSPEYAVRTSMLPGKNGAIVKDIPLYAVAAMKNAIV